MFFPFSFQASECLIKKICCFLCTYFTFSHLTKITQFLCISFRLSRFRIISAKISFFFFSNSSTINLFLSYCIFKTSRETQNNTSDAGHPYLVLDFSEMVFENLKTAVMISTYRFKFKINSSFSHLSCIMLLRLN